MKFKIIFFLLIFNLSFGQKAFLDIDLNRIRSYINLKEAYLIKNDESKNYFVILEEEKTSHAFKFSPKKTLENLITSDGLKRKYKEIIGHVTQGNQVLLLQKNDIGNKFAYIKYNFETQKTEEVEYKLQEKFDRFVESITIDDRCIMFTINTPRRELKKWEFFIDGTYKVNTLSLKDEFDKAGITQKPAETYLLKYQGFKKNNILTKLNNKVPNNLEIAAELNKMYEYDKNFIWTLDNSMNYTLVFNFNFPDYKPVLTVIKKPDLNHSNGISNSFVFEDKIAQIVSSSKELKVEIKSLSKPKSIIKKFHVTRDDEINFKNSPILQEGSTFGFGDTRKMEKTSKFLRKISSYTNGISVHKNNRKYRITIGGTRLQSSNGNAMMPGFANMPIEQFGAMTISYNPTFYAYGMNTSTGSTRIECLFDLDFNHIEGEIEENVFDRIDDFKELNKKLKAESITYLNDEVLFGYWDKKANKYYFKKFD